MFRNMIMKRRVEQNTRNKFNISAHPCIILWNFSNFNLALQRYNILNNHFFFGPVSQLACAFTSFLELLWFFPVTGVQTLEIEPNYGVFLCLNKPGNGSFYLHYFNRQQTVQYVQVNRWIAYRKITKCICRNQLYIRNLLFD